jgi:hypothetical protein
MTSSADLALVSPYPDDGPGSVWPTALLAGGVSAAALAAGTWIALEAAGARPDFGFADWVAEHAVWGMAAGLVVTWILRLGRRVDPALSSPQARRAAALRLGLVSSLALWLVVAATTRALALAPEFVLGGLLAGLALLLFVARLWLRSLRRVSALPRLDPLKVAVGLALLAAPLQDGGAAASLRAAWQVMLGE